MFINMFVHQQILQNFIIVFAGPISIAPKFNFFMFMVYLNSISLIELKFMTVAHIMYRNI